MDGRFDSSVAPSEVADEADRDRCKALVPDIHNDGAIREAATRLLARKKAQDGATAKDFFAEIPLPETMSPEERELYESGEYPIRLVQHLPEHETFADYLIERSLEAWTRSRG